MDFRNFLKKHLQLVSLILLLVVNPIATFHIPGISAHKYKKYEPIKIYAKNIEYQNGLQAFDFFDYFCGEDSTINNAEISDTFLDKFFNDVAHITPFNAIMALNQECKTACSYYLKKTPAELEGTWVKFYIENQPAISIHKQRDYNTVNNDLVDTYKIGAPQVSYHNTMPVLNNHFKFIIYVNNHSTVSQKLIVRVEIEPYSIAEDLTFNEEEKITVKKGCRRFGDDITKAKPLYLHEMNEKSDNLIYITYSIEFRDSKKNISTRWDFGAKNTKIYWISVVRSVVVCILQQLFIWIIFSRALNARIPDQHSGTGMIDRPSGSNENSWKKLKLEVFRPPTFPLIMSVFIGTGSHITIITILTTIFASVFFMSDTHRGDIIISFCQCFLLTSVISGMVSARMYKLLKGVFWLKLTLVASTLLPSLALSIILPMNAILEMENSDMTIDFWHIVFIVSVWAGCYIPQIFIGSLIGFSKAEITVPCKFSLVGRSVINLPSYLNIYATSLIGGILPFGTILYEIGTLIQDFWGGNVQFQFPLLLIAIILLLVTCSQVGVVITFINLIHGNYHWWWQSFFAAASCGLYIFLYSMIFFFTMIGPKNFNHLLLFFGSSLIVSGIAALACGSVSFVSSFLFVRRLYSLVKAN